MSNGRSRTLWTPGRTATINGSIKWFGKDTQERTLGNQKNISTQTEAKLLLLFVEHPEKQDHNIAVQNPQGPVTEKRIAKERYLEYGVVVPLRHALIDCENEEFHHEIQTRVVVEDSTIVSVRHFLLAKIS